ncbi:hypothetical protein RRF57_006070 [Xylaria bambusicola]|uniref:Uncharacterized protein n=1 Tax=Xylaria bambusicola TaxID=326684 RepID=A0AAN7UDP4_9PEZI
MAALGSRPHGDLPERHSPPWADLGANLDQPGRSLGLLSRHLDDCLLSACSFYATSAANMMSHNPNIRIYACHWMSLDCLGQTGEYRPIQADTRLGIPVSFIARVSPCNGASAGAAKGLFSVLSLLSPTHSSQPTPVVVGAAIGSKPQSRQSATKHDPAETPLVS